MSTEKVQASASANPSTSTGITANSLVAAGLTLRGMVISKRDNPKVWEGKTTMWTELGITDGEQTYVFKIKHPDHDKGVRAVVPNTLTQVCIRVNYCSTEKGQITVQGVLAA